jgi:hypothetical protein
MRRILFGIGVVSMWCSGSAAQALQTSRVGATVVLWEEGFPAADTATPKRAVLEQIGPDVAFTSARQLGDNLARPETRLLVLPFGSAFPEESWEPILSFLERGGNLLVVGGRPFTRAAYPTQNGWQLRGYNLRFSRELRIDQYETTPGGEGMSFEANPDIPLKLPPFPWNRGFSPIIRLSAKALYNRGGSTGSIDARLDALAWGVKDGRRWSAPAIVIDHWRNGFNGGRWIFFNADLPSAFYNSQVTTSLLRDVAELARLGSLEFSVRPMLPLYLTGESVELEVKWNSATHAETPVSLRITTYPEGQPARRSVTTQNLPLASPVVSPAPPGKGLYRIDAELVEAGKTRAIYHSGFWMRDEPYLRSGPRLTVNHDYFELDSHPLAVVGTTYMSSEVQRLFFEHPNVYVWDRDFGQISAAGLNMIRTGWWTAWDKVCDENGQPYERTLRTLEAYLMSARKYRLPVQFNFFAFLPEVLGGTNAYLDPEAVRKQQTLVSAVVSRFHDVPYLAWDLINEPSFSERLWTMRPNGDAIELAEWNQWLNRRYRDRAGLAAAWNMPVSALSGTMPVPGELEFSERGTYDGHNSLKLYDFFLFAQESFANWVKGMESAIRTTGSMQLITVGQDEGGYADRLFPGFFTPYIDFTVNHSWWQNDSLLWDSLVAKQPAKAMLIQETGLQRELTLDEIARRSPEEDAALFERKVATSFVAGSGAIEWLWNLNEYMTESNESPIGAVRADATEKPEATVMRRFAEFAKAIAPDLEHPEPAAVTIVTSQAAQFSALSDLQLEAQRRAVRALVYHGRVPGSILPENQIEKLGNPKLVILPSPQALIEKTWKFLMAYVNQGGHLLVTGPVERDEHWQRVRRALDFGAQPLPLTAHQVELRLDGQLLSCAFDQHKQGVLEALRFGDGTTFKEITQGKGQIFWTAYPVELAEGLDAAASVYRYVLNRVGVSPPFEMTNSLSPGVMIYPTVLRDAILYVITSETAEDTDLDVRDKLSGGRLALRLPAQHAALALISKSGGTVKAKYGF